MICHTHNFQIFGRECHILPWSWQSRSFLTGISHGSPSRTQTNSENHVWEGQNRATRRRRSLHVFTLHNTAGMSLTRGKAYSFMSGQGCASASIPREAGWERENQRGHWVDPCDTMKSTSAAPNLSQIRSTIRWSSIHSPDLSFCLDKKQSCPPLGSGPLGHGPLSGTKMFPVPKEEAGAHVCSMCVPGSPPGDWCEGPPPCCPSWRWHASSSGTEESEWELDELLSTPERLCARPGTCLTGHHKPVVPRKPLPTQRGKRPLLPFGNSRLPPYVLHSGENWDHATLKGRRNRCLPQGAPSLSQ